MIDLLTATRLTDAQLTRLSAKSVRALEAQASAWVRRDVQANQLWYYRVVNPEAVALHRSTAREFGIQGGNKAGKTGTMLAEMAIQMTGIIPRSLLSEYPPAKAGRAKRVRLVVTSLTSAWDVNLKRKFQYFEWNGRPNGSGLAGDPDTGHYGWIPQRFLPGGDWTKAWSEKHQMLTLTNGATLQVMSHTQDLKEFNQGSFDLIVCDELPPEDVVRALRLRVLETGGQLIMGGTPSDERSEAVSAAWFFDSVIQPGLEQSAPAEVGAVVLWTEHNRTLDPANVEFVAKGMTEEQRRARLHGDPIHLGGLIFPGVTVAPKTWCLRCAGARRLDQGRCRECGSPDVTGYSHAWDDADLQWPGPRDWPTLFYMDPHQAKPTACAWVKVDPEDAWWQVAELEIAGDAGAVKRECEAFEAEHRLTPRWRRGDPKITAQTNQFAREFQGERFTIRRAFEEVGFDFLEANTNFTVGRERLLQAFAVQPGTRRPRFRIHRTRCPKTLYQYLHFVWHAATASGGKEQPSRYHSDFPALGRYLALDDPSWTGLERLQTATPLRIGASGTGRNSATGW